MIQCNLIINTRSSFSFDAPTIFATHMVAIQYNDREEAHDNYFSHSVKENQNTHGNEGCFLSG